MLIKCISLELRLHAANLKKAAEREGYYFFFKIILGETKDIRVPLPFLHNAFNKYVVYPHSGNRLMVLV